MNALYLGTEYAAMRKFNVFELYSFGRSVASLSDLPREDTQLKKVRLALYFAKEALTKQLLLDSILLPASKRAVQELVDEIDKIMPGKTPLALFATDGSEMIDAHKFHYIRGALEKLEAVLGADMPGIASYVVAQKGIYKTEGLIENAAAHLSKTVAESLPEQALVDIKEAGKCLAFELCTASSFHMWRAVEAVICQYYEAITGRTLREDRVTRNWGAYIDKLNKIGAKTKVTAFLDHIREEYRNPISHPEGSIDIEESLNLFAAACSAINQMANEIRKLREGNSQLALISSGDDVRDALPAPGDSSASESSF